jgi:hypothetical protein
MGGILQVDTIKNNNASTIITQTNTTTLTFGSSGQTIVIPSGTTFNASSASVNLPSINLATGVTGTLPIANGGTNLTTYTTGDLLYASNATTLTKLGVGSSGQGLVVSGGVPAWGTSGPSAGQVIQVLSATDSTARSTTSSSFVTASNTLSVTITPSSTSNKIFIIISSSGRGINDNAYYTIYRGATNLGNGNLGFTTQYDGATGVDSSVSMTYLDSPSTTSATTYQVYFRNNSSGLTSQLNRTGCTGVITCMEIKG